MIGGVDVTTRHSGQNLHARLVQLGAHDPGNRPADDARDDGEDQIERSNVLVIRGQEPAGEEAGLVVGVMRMGMIVVMRCFEMMRGGVRCHDLKVRFR